MSEPLSPNPFATSAGADDSPGPLWRQHAFLRMWVSRLMATGGTQMLMVAIGWRMYELTSSAWDLGLVGLFQFDLIASIFGGMSSTIARVLYTLVGLAGIWGITLLFRRDGVKHDEH